MITKNNCASPNHNCEPFFEIDVLYLGFIYARHALQMQKNSDHGSEDCLIEAGLGWKRFGRYKENREISTYNDK